jgi:hypothetical protein
MAEGGRARAWLWTFARIPKHEQDDAAVFITDEGFR